VLHTTFRIALHAWLSLLGHMPFSSSSNADVEAKCVATMPPRCVLVFKAACGRSHLQNHCGFARANSISSFNDPVCMTAAGTTCFPPSHHHTHTTGQIRLVSSDAL
jgi:hypothetical protein